MVRFVSKFFFFFLVEDRKNNTNIGWSELCNEYQQKDRVMSFDIFLFSLLTYMWTILYSHFLINWS